jgi:pimeloyl-ACP methyl ester carboxylesterase
MIRRATASEGGDVGDARRTLAIAVAVVAATAMVAPSVAAAAEPVALATTMTGTRVAGGDPHALGAASVDVVDGALCVELQLSASALPAPAARLVGPATAVALPAPDAAGRAAGCDADVPGEVLDALAATPTAFSVEVPGIAQGGLQPRATEGTLLGARLGGLTGSGVATVAANPELGRLCSEVPGGGTLRRTADGAVVADLPDGGCVRGLDRALVAAVARRPTDFVVESTAARGPLAPATSFAGPALPRFDAHACAAGVFPSPRIACGTLTVSEDRAEPAGPTVELPVAVLRTASPTPQPDPVVYFEGGPGFGAIENAESFLEHEYGADRDLILFDQRGTGGARPSLDCPEVHEATWQAFATTDATDAEREGTLAAFDACRARLTAAGVDLDTYDTGVSAEDVEDLRLALGIDEWNLFGVSYGTTLALQALRAHPERVRSVVLDSVFPTTVGGTAGDIAAGADRAFGAVYAGCAADAACAAAYPDLPQVLGEVVARYDATPHPTSVTDPVTGQEHALLITGRDILSGLFQALYDDELIPLVPSLLTALRQGDTGIIDLFADQALPLLLGAAEGMSASVQCSDRAAFPDDLDLVLAERPELGSLLGIGAWSCARWDVDPAAPGFNEPVSVDVPALVLADEYDPITPPADSRAVADALPDATFVHFPGLGHGAVFSHLCPEAVYTSFLADPAAPDTSCVAAMGPPAWALPAP